MINPLELNSVQNLLNLNFDNSNINNVVKSENQINVNTIEDSSNISLDSEAQELMSAIGNDLQGNESEAISVHQGLNYSRVMQLLEGL